jgi:hypothetical protein
VIEVTDEIRRAYARAWFDAIGMDEEDAAQMAESEVSDPMPWRDAALAAVLAIIERDHPEIERARIDELEAGWSEMHAQAAQDEEPF